MKLLPFVFGILIAVALTGSTLLLRHPSPKAIAPQAPRIFTTPIGLGDTEMRRYELTIPFGWDVLRRQSQAPWDEASAREGIMELHLRRTDSPQEGIVVRIAEECRVHPHQGLAVAFNEYSGHEHNHVPLTKSWMTKRGVEGVVLKEFLPDGHLIGYKMVTPTCKIGYLDVHSTPGNSRQVSSDTLEALARQLFASLRLLTSDGKEVKD